MKSGKYGSSETSRVMCLKFAMLMLMLIAFAATVSAAASLTEPGASRSTYDGEGASCAANLDANLSDNPGCTSQNNSSIRWESKSRIARAPASVSVGNGYYSSHPISYSNGISSETLLKNKGASTSMQHSILYAHGIDGETQVEASDGSYHLGDLRSSRTSETHMMVNENVTQGQVHIGVLQGDTSNLDSGGERRGPTATALKKPVVEMEEDYTGTYHIYKNMSINTPLTEVRRTDSWLDFCGGDCLDGYPQGSWPHHSWYSSSRPHPWAISEERVFNCSCADAGPNQID
ncbi:MAG: hypothetical protein A4E48_02078 [Methanosaeta sp. PtaU1.Bin060]|nr:MAG: hypothetical protein A4E48_02078 [Methanosaeta sp. PtaU1.Bin060]